MRCTFNETSGVDLVYEISKCFGFGCFEVCCFRSWDSGIYNLADKAGVEDGLVGELNSQTDLSSSLPSEQSGDDCRQEHVEEEEFVGAQNISMSRMVWRELDASPVQEWCIDA